MPEPATQTVEQQDLPILSEGTEPELPSPPTPTIEDQLRSEREDKARLQGLLQAKEDELRRAMESPPAETTPEPEQLTPENIEALDAAGRLTSEEKSRLYARYEVQELFRKKQERDREESIYRVAREGLEDLMEKHPDLNNGQSALIQEVRTELLEMSKLGYDPKDVRTQYLAAKAVIGRRGIVTPTKEHGRLKIPVGGGGGDFGGEPPGGQGKPKVSKGQELFGRLTDEAKAFYKDYHGGDMAKIYKTLDHADEGILRRSGRFK